MEPLYPEFVLAEGPIQEFDAPRIRKRTPNSATHIARGDGEGGRGRQYSTGCRALTTVHPICRNDSGMLLGDHNSHRDAIGTIGRSS